MNYAFNRAEARRDAVIAVMLVSLDGRVSTECTFTENISSHGARVLTIQQWRADDAVVIKSLEGDFQSEARVVYRQRVNEKSNGLGLVLDRPTGSWAARPGCFD